VHASRLALSAESPAPKLFRPPFPRLLDPRNKSPMSAVPRAERRRLVELTEPSNLRAPAVPQTTDAHVDLEGYLHSNAKGPHLRPRTPEREVAILSQTLSRTPQI